ncbi:MAG: MOSC domain-containing protein [Saprospiraceae bacterium]|nr:MOSC domain-containing protein [Saprospiraceae bacterium]
MKGISVESAFCKEEGFENDRRFMLVDETGKFISQRSHPKLALFKQSINESSLTLDFEGSKQTIPFTFEEGSSMQVSVFDDTMEATPHLGPWNEWFSDILDSKLTIVKHTGKTQRIKKLLNAPMQTKVSFADGYPYLVLGTASLKELNKKLDSPVRMDRFRANIIVATERAHEEDSWESCKIGKVRFGFIKPCARCQVPTIDQQSAERGAEPIKTLAGYRKKGNKIFFGMNAISLDQGTVRVNDQVIF